VDIRALDASEVLSNTFLEEYKQGMRLFYFELVNLNTNVYIMEKINEFPFKLFCSPTNTIFFSTVIKNLYDVSILTITKLAADKAGDLSTLLQFKNQVIKSIKPEYRDELRELLKQTKFDNGITSMLSIATAIRNSRIAHLKINDIFNDQIKRLKIENLKELAETLNSLLQALSFNVEQLLVPLTYSEYAIQNSDIENILDSIARGSNILNLPETVPTDAWERQKKRMSLTEIEKLNMYRKKFGLPEA